ncbi:MAG: hypothetical protein P4M05_24365 [Bradyrhizobium sp.]|jgi:hypothetical protein|nr:hypothetical protein [Bradyrhizobium sp.]
MVDSLRSNAGSINPNFPAGDLIEIKPDEFAAKRSRFVDCLL